MSVFLDRVYETTTTGGTATMSLAGAVSGWRDFATAAAVLSETSVFYFRVGQAGTVDAAKWEFGYGTITAGSPDTLTRNALLSSAGAATKESFTSSITSDVFSTPIAEVLNSLLATHAGTSRPAWLRAGGLWIDTSGGAAAWLLKCFDGSDDITLGLVDSSGNTFKPYYAGTDILARANTWSAKQIISISGANDPLELKVDAAYYARAIYERGSNANKWSAGADTGLNYAIADERQGQFRLYIDGSGNLNLVAGAYQLNGTGIFDRANTWSAVQTWTAASNLLKTTNDSGGSDNLEFENASTANNTNKTVLPTAAYGRDTVNVRKQVGYARWVPADANWVGSYFQLYVRSGDSVTLAFEGHPGYLNAAALYYNGTDILGRASTWSAKQIISIGGASDPLELRVDAAYYARVIYERGSNANKWSAGADTGLNYAIADERQGQFRLYIDGSGNLNLVAGAYQLNGTDIFARSNTWSNTNNFTGTLQVSGSEVYHPGNEPKGTETWIFHSGFSNIGSGTAGYCGPMGTSSTFDSVKVRCNRAGTFDLMYAHAGGDPGTPNGYPYTFYKNGAATSLTCTTDDGQTTSEDTSNSVTVAAGDYVAVLVDPTGPAANQAHRITVRFTPS